VIASETETGCRLTARKAADLGHGIQEWHVFNPRREFHLDLPDSEILDISPDPDGNRIVVLTNQRCFWVDWGEESLLLANLPVYSMDRPLRALCRTSERGILGIGRDGYLYPLRQTDGIAPIPVLGLCDAVRVFPTFRGFLWVDADGEVFEWLDAADAVVPRGGIPLCPVHALALVPDGRIFAFAGEAIAHWFLLMGERTWARDLGVPVSTLSVRRYGLEFSELLVGPDGEIYAAEDDQGGHLWIYFPPIR
jgi:hypothetical protein